MKKYFKYSKELHKFCCAELKYDNLINSLMSPLVYVAFMSIMLLNIKEYRLFKPNDTKKLEQK